MYPYPCTYIQSSKWLTRGVNSVVTLHSKEKVWHELDYCLNSCQMSDGRRTHLGHIILSGNSHFSSLRSLHMMAGNTAFTAIPICYEWAVHMSGSHVPVLCGAVNTKFLFTILKNSAGNISPQFEEMLQLPHMFVAHPCSMLLVSHWDLTNNSCLIMCCPCTKLKRTSSIFLCFIILLFMFLHKKFTVFWTVNCWSLSGDILYCCVLFFHHPVCARMCTIFCALPLAQKNTCS